MIPSFLKRKEITVILIMKCDCNSSKETFCLCARCSLQEKLLGCLSQFPFFSPCKMASLNFITGSELPIEIIKKKKKKKMYRVHREFGPLFWKRKPRNASSQSFILKALKYPTAWFQVIIYIHIYIYMYMYTHTKQIEIVRNQVHQEKYLFSTDR